MSALSTKVCFLVVYGPIVQIVLVPLGVYLLLKILNKGFKLFDEEKFFKIFVVLTFVALVLSSIGFATGVREFINCT